MKGAHEIGYFAQVGKIVNFDDNKTIGLTITILLDKVIYAVEHGFIDGFKVKDREKFAESLKERILEVKEIEQYEEDETAFEGLINAICTQMCEDADESITYLPSS